ncbi:hypothetical protein CDAR_305471 [Caerostris darwini]|uniref:Uncharacterized protein n=1 Tax=Caerostris darwini TaxID=1538125 RepID=A0AAV4MCN7_9ARAC|nr:hypothetical protein CDAR_305471 [Caerostris darwini]
MDKIIPSLQGEISADECPAINTQNVPLLVKFAVNKYRKLVSWWTFVRETPRVLNSDLNYIFNYAKAFNNIPLHNFSAQYFQMTSTFLTFQKQVVNIEEGLDHLSCEIHNLMKLAVNSHLGLFSEFSTQYNEIIETACEILEEFVICRELLLNFIISRQIILGHNALNDANIQFNMQNEHLYNKW